MRTDNVPMWSTIRNAWKGYKIAKGKGEVEKQKEYARAVNQLEEKLGRALTEFACLSSTQ